jgi:hypothetical protein
MAILLGFVLRMGSRGLWMGIVCGSLSQTTLMSAITFFTDWPKMVRTFISPIRQQDCAHNLLHAASKDEQIIESSSKACVLSLSLMMLCSQAEKARERVFSDKPHEPRP